MLALEGSKLQSKCTAFDYLLRPHLVLCTKGDKPGVYRGAIRPVRKFVQRDFSGAVVKDVPLSAAAQRLRTLEDILSHDQWDPVAGRDVLWQEVAALLAANPLLRTTLIVPAKPEEVVDWKRRSLSTSADFSWVVVALEEQDIDMLREALKDKRVPINVLAGPYRESPLHLAVSEVGNLDLVELLLRRHADVNAGLQPLYR